MIIHLERIYLNEIFILLQQWLNISKNIYIIISYIIGYS